jgi:hypothetical protein
MSRLFYKIQSFSKKQKHDLIQMMRNKSILIKIEELDCNISISRAKSNLSLDEALTHVGQNSFYSLCTNIEPDWETKTVNSELVIRTQKSNSDVEVFIWIYVKNEDFLEIKNHLKLSAY